MIQVDVNTRVISSSSRIWVVHPGRGKIFETDFARKNVVFLDFPRLQLTASDNLMTPRLRQKIQRSRAWRMFLDHRNDALRAGESPPPEPSFDLQSYSGDSTSRSLSNAQSTVSALYFTAEPGDLILVPTGKGQFGHINFAEITSKFDPEATVLINGDRQSAVPTRSVRWLAAKPQRRTVNEALARRVENKRAAIEIDKSFLGNQVYTLAYQNFSTPEFSKTTLLGPTYRSKNAFDIVGTVELTSWLIAAFHAVLAGEADALNSMSIREVVDSDRFTGYVQDVK